jgi:hypothetical protein
MFRHTYVRVFFEYALILFYKLQFICYLWKKKTTSNLLMVSYFTSNINKRKLLLQLYFSANYQQLYVYKFDTNTSNQ